VALVALSWWSAEQRQMDIHRWSGSVIAGLLVLRVYWGFAGPRTARFASFIKGPATIGRYVGALLSRRDYRPAFGHNPLGGLSVAAMIIVLMLHVGLGLFAMDTDGLESGPLARFVSYDTASTAGELHHTTFNVLLALIALHLLAIAFYALVKRANLIGPMITGRRTRLPSDTGDPGETLERTPLWRSLPGLALGAATTAALVLI
jgi:cytochrome b